MYKCPNKNAIHENMFEVRNTPYTYSLPTCKNPIRRVSRTNLHIGHIRPASLVAVFHHSTSNLQSRL